MPELTPRQIVQELDRYIVGQDAAKRAVAVAIRNRWRRQQLAPEMRKDIVPKNIIMIGPTGVGKTEIARRLAQLVGAPFLKVEATKYTEVGYHGRDVESMVRDLTEAAIAMVRLEQRRIVETQAKERVNDRLLELLLPGSGSWDEENHEENDRQQITLRKCIDNIGWHDVEREVQQSHFFTGRDIRRHRFLLDAHRGNVERRTWLHHVHDHQSNGERQRTYQLEIEQRLAANSSEFSEVGHARNAVHNRQEDDRGNHHLHEIDERVSQRLECLARVRPKRADEDAEQYGQYDLSREIFCETTEHEKSVRGKDGAH